MIDVVSHVLEKLESERYICDIAVLLQPTSPLRTKKDINEALNSYIKNDCDSVISVNKIEHSPYWSFKIKEIYLEPLFGYKYLKSRRQELSNIYIPNGAIFISSPRILNKYNSFYCKKMLPHIMSTEKSVDIDNEYDFKIAEILIKK